MGNPNQLGGVIERKVYQRQFTELFSIMDMFATRPAIREKSNLQWIVVACLQSYTEIK